MAKEILRRKGSDKMSRTKIRWVLIFVLIAAILFSVWFYFTYLDKGDIGTRGTLVRLMEDISDQ